MTCRLHKQIVSTRKPVNIMLIGHTLNEKNTRPRSTIQRIANTAQSQSEDPFVWSICATFGFVLIEESMLDNILLDEVRLSAKGGG
jgi:hypothetical protein